MPRYNPTLIRIGCLAASPAHLPNLRIVFQRYSSAVSPERMAPVTDGIRVRIIYQLVQRRGPTSRKNGSKSLFRVAGHLLGRVQRCMASSERGHKSSGLGI